MKSMHGALSMGLVLALILCLAGVSRADDQRLAFLDNLNTGTLGNIGKKIETATKVVKATQKATAEITPEQEYYIGRAVAASILQQYRPYKNQELNRYLNELGQSLAAASDKPQTFGGYHFLALDSDEINAFAAPGGLILVAKGLVKVARNEDELAAVLAHEIGHVQHQHGLGAIKQSRMMDLGGLLVKEGAKEFGGQDVNKLTNVFGESVGDITKTLMVNGYSRSQESEADTAAVTILKRVGYPPQALVGMLKKMKAQYPHDPVGFAKTHPDPLDRVADVQKKIGKKAAPAPPEARQERYAKAMDGV
jgi:predicted Zn-dependent protease